MISEFNSNRSRIPVVNIVGNFVLVSTISTQDTSQYLQTKNKGNTGKKKEIVTETEEIHVSIV